MTLPPADDIVIVVIGALVAGFVNGLTGTAYALAAMSFWLHAMPPTFAAPLVCLCAVGGHLQALPQIWQGVRWPRLWPFLIAGLIGVPLGTMLLSRVQPSPLKLGIGLLLVVYVSWNFFVRRPPAIRTWGGRIADAVAGFIGGVLGGMASISGPVPVTWVQLRDWTRNEQRGVNQPYNMAILALALVSAAVSGLLDSRWLFWATVTLPMSLIGTRFGLLAYGRVNDLQFRRIVLAMLAVSGVALIISGLT
jgi:uncharacterized membrane protein YfcA